MKAEAQTEAEGPIPCPTCGTVSEANGVGGMCPKCFAKAALDTDQGWLHSVEKVNPSSTAMPEVPGWKITGVLGAGGMGRVYSAELEADGSTGAIKVLDARWAGNPMMTARFEAEASALMTLEHPHIVKVLDLTETLDGRFCLIMELVDGCDLGRLMLGERITQGRAVEIFRKVCSAVDYAHAQGFVHRDIKPANILVDHQDMVKLGDFGLAKKTGTSTTPGMSSIGGLTVTTDRFGTAYYVAPEVLLHGQSGDTAADIYALGVLLYHLLAGQMPIGRYTPVSQITGLSKTFDHIIANALEADPSKRTSKASALNHAVGAAWQDYQNGAHRLRRWRRAAIVATIACLVAITAVAGALWERGQMKPPAPPVFGLPSAATLERPWVNSLGMKFVPVPGTQVLFSIWESRRRDLEPYLLSERQILTSTWRANYPKNTTVPLSQFYILDTGGKLRPTGSWWNPGYPVTPEHPACFVVVREAQRYCLWLTWKEQNEGRLKPGQRYRLPTSTEWFAACGGEKATRRPGNVAGTEARDDSWPQAWPTLDERDPFPRAAPVGSFPAELHGLYDISGNMSEWVLDEDEDIIESGVNSKAMLRGPAFNDGTPDTTTFTYVRMMPLKKVMRLPNVGFRVVLEWQQEEGDETAAPAATTPSK